MQDLRPVVQRFSGLVPASDEIEDRIIRAYTFPWFYHNGTTRSGFDADENEADSLQFVHNFVVDGRLNSPHFQPILELMRWDRIVADLNIPEGINRMKANLIPRQHASFEHPPHVDFEGPHVVLLYYINDSDGDTIFYDRDGDGEFTPVARETPAKGDLLVFDGSIYHSSSSPSKSKCRAVINFNLVDQ